MESARQEVLAKMNALMKEENLSASEAIHQVLASDDALKARYFDPRGQDQRVDLKIVRLSMRVVVENVRSKRL